MYERRMRFHDDETPISGAHVIVPAMLLPCQYVDRVRRRVGTPPGSQRRDDP